MKDKYVVYENCSDRACWICKDEEVISPFVAEWLFTGTKEECEQYLKKLKEETTFYSVFQTEFEEEAYVVKMDRVSGMTYRGVMHNKTDREIKDFDTREEAEEYIEKYLYGVE